MAKYPTIKLGRESGEAYLAIAKPGVDLDSNPDPDELRFDSRLGSANICVMDGEGSVPSTAGRSPQNVMVDMPVVAGDRVVQWISPRSGQTWPSIASEFGNHYNGKAITGSFLASTKSAMVVPPFTQEEYIGEMLRYNYGIPVPLPSGQQLNTTLINTMNNANVRVVGFGEGEETQEGPIQVTDYYDNPFDPPASYNAVLGAPDPDRHIIVAMGNRAAFGVSIRPSSVTIRGVSATLAVHQFGNCSLWIAHVPNGLTGNIVSNGFLISMCIYRCTRLVSASPFSTASGQALSGGISRNLSVPARGIVIAAAHSIPNQGGQQTVWGTANGVFSSSQGSHNITANRSPSPITWTGVTQDMNFELGNPGQTGFVETNLAAACWRYAA